MMTPSVALALVITMVCNVILPSLDVYGDVVLMVNTLNFNLGDTQSMSGCRACYAKNGQEIYAVSSRPFQQYVV